MNQLVLKNKDNGLFWNNDSGWGSRVTATRFSVEEKELVRIPIDGVFVSSELTDDEVAAYLKNPTKCPYCQSVSIKRTGSPENLPGWDAVGQSIACFNDGCGMEWRDRYRLEGIDEDDVPE
jgi:hypothetical protein